MQQNGQTVGDTGSANLARPLVVDLDGTLLRSDLLIESALGYLRRGIVASFHLLPWLVKGKSALKEALASRVELAVELLPYNQEVVAFIRQEKNRRTIVLATASHSIYAERVAEHLGLFDRVIATTSDVNMSAEAKRDRLVREFGRKGFDYIGNANADLAIWEAAGEAYLADPETGVLQKARRLGNVAQVFKTRQSPGRAFLKGLRPYQWLKNLLVFVPLIAAHQFTNLPLIGLCLLAFALFSLAASGGYMLNDLLDLESDRYHPRKRLRPLASGELPIRVGILAMPLLLLLALGVSGFLLPVRFTLCLAFYITLTVAYSQYLKRVAAVDTIVLTGLYTIRILAGSFACGIMPSFWMLAFSMFLFLSLAMVKRYTELLDARAKGISGQTKGRGYFPADLEIIASLGVSSGYMSVLVLALYIQDAKTVLLYHNPTLIWLACPILLFWFSRLWMIAHRGEMHDDPLLFAIRDRASLISGALFAAVFLLAMVL